jgi:hypothetical protein
MEEATEAGNPGFPTLMMAKCIYLSLDGTGLDFEDPYHQERMWSAVHALTEEEIDRQTPA